MQPPLSLFKIKNLKTSECQHLSWGKRDKLRRYEPKYTPAIQNFGDASRTRSVSIPDGEFTKR